MNLVFAARLNQVWQTKFQNLPEAFCHVEIGEFSLQSKICKSPLHKIFVPRLDVQHGAVLSHPSLCL